MKKYPKRDKIEGVQEVSLTINNFLQLKEEYRHPNYYRVLSNNKK